MQVSTFIVCYALSSAVAGYVSGSYYRQFFSTTRSENMYIYVYICMYIYSFDLYVFMYVDIYIYIYSFDYFPHI
jgi:hypothetical protein